MRRARSTRRGATAIEFVLTVPVLFVMVSGIATYAWLFVVQASLVDAVTEGARRSVSFVAAPGQDDDGDDETDDFGRSMLAVAEVNTRAACVRAGWAPEAVRVRVDLGEMSGLNTLRIHAEGNLASRFGGLLFPLPETVTADIEVATVDQR